MLAPSKAIPSGALPTSNVPRTFPSLARSFMTVPTRPSPFVTTHTLAPSKADAIGELPTVKFPRFLPSLARNLVTVLVPFGTQMFEPSNVDHVAGVDRVNV